MCIRDRLTVVVAGPLRQLKLTQQLVGFNVKDHQNTVPRDDIQIIAIPVDYVGGSRAIMRRREVVSRRQRVVLLDINLNYRVVVVVHKDIPAIWRTRDRLPIA